MMDDHFTKEEVFDYMMENVYHKPIDEVRKMCGIHGFKFDNETRTSSFIFMDGPAHSWLVTITPDKLILE